MIASLRPCPFCGGVGRIRGSLEKEFWAECSECDVQIGAMRTLEGDIEGLYPEEHAVRLWNTRVTHD